MVRYIVRFVVINFFHFLGVQEMYFNRILHHYRKKKRIYLEMMKILKRNCMFYFHDSRYMTETHVCILNASASSIADMHGEAN